MAKRDWSGFEPHSRVSGDMYRQALVELATEYPAIPLPHSKLFNETVGGFRVREFSILCGATGLGKTTLLSNWGKSWFELPDPSPKPFIMSVETGATDYVKRVMSVFLGKDINEGHAVPTSVLQKFDKDFGRYFRSNKMFLSLYDGRVNLNTVMDEILYHHEVHGSKIVVIDNLNFLLEVVAQNQAVAEMDRVVHELIMLCKRTDIHIIMVMHPRKTDGGRVDSEFDIKGSSTAVQEAHNVFLLNRPKNTERWGQYHRELTLQKLRRRGKHTRKRIIYRCVETRYEEVELECP